MKILSHISSRRKFLEAIGIAAGILAVKPTTWAQGRKEIWIAGKRIKTVDIHAHASIKDVEEVIRGTSLERRIGGPRLLEPSRLVMMDEWGIDVSVISANQYWWYRTDDELLAAEIVRVQDEGFAAWCNAYPDRFVALTSVAMQFPDLAAGELDYAVNLELDPEFKYLHSIQDAYKDDKKSEPIHRKLKDLKSNMQKNFEEA